MGKTALNRYGSTTLPTSTHTHVLCCTTKYRYSGDNKISVVDRHCINADPDLDLDLTLSFTHVRGIKLNFYSAVLWNRNRRNRNFLPCGTGFVTCQKVGTGTIIQWYHKSSHKPQHKIVYSISFIKHFFCSHFTIILMKLINFYFVKSLECKKARFIPK
jgi:hypothetical protein